MERRTLLQRHVATMITRVAVLLMVLLGPAAALACTKNDSLKISGLAGLTPNGESTEWSEDKLPEVKLNDWLKVWLTGDDSFPIDPSTAVLLLNGHEISKLPDTVYLPSERALLFHLRRTNATPDPWKPLLGSPGFAPREVEVSIALKAKPSDDPICPIAGVGGKRMAFDLVLISIPWLLVGGVALLLVLAVVWAAASNTNILKDSLLPQLAPAEQPFSLGRWQMAFWFTLVFAAFLFLFMLLWDYNTLTAQSLMLMGISSATAVFAIAIDASKDTPIGAANETLRALGLNTYADVLHLYQEIADRTAALNKVPPEDPDTRLRLQTELTDRLNKKRTYWETTRPFVSSGWYRDLTADINGPALHRLQVFVWTLTLGAVFVIQVYRDLAMPDFSATMLALMGVTSAGYLGFKYPEKQN